MIVEIINTGSELMLGRVLNTHQQWLCRRLADAGYGASRQVAIPDASHDIQQAVREALGRADLILTTGGLGPTSDDITRDLIARLLKRPLREDATVLADLTRFYTRRSRTMPERVKVQALVPDGARVLPNAHGTAPGLAMKLAPNPFRPDGKATWLVMLPGPPRELHPMFDTSVLPLLREEFPLQTGFVCRTLRTVGMPESIVEEQIAGSLATLVRRGLELGYCARVGEVDVRLVARTADAPELVAAAEAIVRMRIGSHICSADDEEIENVIVQLLTERRQTLAVAESCTGGLIAHRITNVPGASAVFLAGFVTYANEAKQKFLGVRSETLAQHGAVSEPTVREMAEGARRQSGADFAIAVTGIAGPAGGTDAKPVGTAFIGVAAAGAARVERLFNPLDRETFKRVVATRALALLRQVVLGKAGHPAQDASQYPDTRK